MKKNKIITLFVFIVALAFPINLYAEDGSNYESEEEKEFYEYFNLDKETTDEYSRTLFDQAKEAQDRAAAIKAAQFIGKPYSLLSTLNTTDTFYCSQLVYQAYRLGAGVSLPHGLPGIITPADLLQGVSTEIIYRNE